MNGAVDEEERIYWLAEEQSRSIAVDAARSRGDPPHLRAAAELRLKEVKERLAAMLSPASKDG